MSSTPIPILTTSPTPSIPTRQTSATATTTAAAAAAAASISGDQPIVPAVKVEAGAESGSGSDARLPGKAQQAVTQEDEDEGVKRSIFTGAAEAVAVAVAGPSNPANEHKNGMGNGIGYEGGVLGREVQSKKRKWGLMGYGEDEQQLLLESSTDLHLALLLDQTATLFPPPPTAFTSYEDAIDRLVPYHIWQVHDEELEVGPRKQKGKAREVQEATDLVDRIQSIQGRFLKARQRSDEHTGLPSLISQLNASTTLLREELSAVQSTLRQTRMEYNALQSVAQKEQDERRKQAMEEERAARLAREAKEAKEVKALPTPAPAVAAAAAAATPSVPITAPPARSQPVASHPADTSGSRTVYTPTPTATAIATATGVIRTTASPSLSPAPSAPSGPSTPRTLPSSLPHSPAPAPITPVRPSLTPTASSGTASASASASALTPASKLSASSSPATPAGATPDRGRPRGRPRGRGRAGLRETALTHAHTAAATAAAVFSPPTPVSRNVVGAGGPGTPGSTKTATPPVPNLIPNGQAAPLPAPTPSVPGTGSAPNGTAPTAAQGPVSITVNLALIPQLVALGLLSVPPIPTGPKMPATVVRTSEDKKGVVLSINLSMCSKTQLQGLAKALNVTAKPGAAAGAGAATPAPPPPAATATATASGTTGTTSGSNGA